MKRKQGDGWSLISADGEVGDDGAGKVVSLPPGDQRFEITVEKRAKGKSVTVVKGLVLDKKDLAALAKKLKAACGTGGTAKEGTIELQGDCTDRAREFLTRNGWGA